MSRRLSLGAALRDAASSTNARSALSETPVKSHDALLEWRLNRTRQYGCADEQGPVKRQRLNEPLRPPAFVPEATTALERFHSTRKHPKLMQPQTNNSFDESFGTTSYYDDADDTATLYSARTAATPGQRRLPTSTARRKTIMPMASRNSSFLSQDLIDQVAPRDTSLTMSQLTAETESQHKREPVDTVEGAGLRSTIREMQQRIDQLEMEKMELAMSKAPLEARLRQKEDSWMKDQARLIEEIDTLRFAAREDNEQYRDLLLQFESKEEEVKHLQIQVRKASSSLNALNGPMFSGSWSKQVQNDRENAELKEKLRNAAEDLDSLRLAKVSIEKELHATKIELEAVARTYEELHAEYEEVARSTSDNRDAEIQLEVLQTEHIATSAQLNAVCAELAATKARAEATLAQKEQVLKKEIDQLQFEISVLKTRAGKICIDESSALSDEVDEAVWKARVEERERRIRELEAEVLRGEEIRRHMHNRIQELRGNIRVFVRTRPFLPSDGQVGDSAIDVSPDLENMSILDERSSSTHSFKFDKVFPPSSGQDHVFQEVADFVQSALDGYQVCLFSYGQTGSGKTHTMQGSGNGAMRGIIPRAVEQILMQANVQQKQKWDFHLRASFLEIYNETLKDLLSSMSSDKDVAKNPPKLTIKRTREGKSYVEGLTEVPIDTVNSMKGMSQLESLMAVAARARSVASTKMNAHSSRSHSVFMLHIRGHNEDSSAEVQGSLNLCDLAGSERLDRSGANNDAKRLKETQAINKSLSCLGDVFNALAQGASHVPFRNSKLTYLLQDCLSGDGKALMFVNLSPTTMSSGESLCSLRFAQRVNQVELGKPTKNIQYNR